MANHEPEHLLGARDPYLEFIDHERATLFFLWLSFGASGVLASLAWLSDLQRVSLLIGAICPASLLLLLLHRLGRPRLAGQLLVLLIPISVTANILEGNGLHDPGVIGYAITIVVGTLLGGRRIVLPLALVVVGLSVVVYFAELRGELGPFRQNGTWISDPFDLSVVIVLVTVVSALTYRVVQIVERNMERVQASEQEVTDAYDLTLEGWARALELRDKETEGHSRRVSELTVEVARHLGYGEAALAQIRRGALLHDIGKMAVPDRILHKKTSLSEHEWEVIRRHTTYARDLLEPIDFLHDALAIPSSHHEAWDGSGYPEGLRGEEIPREARIFALADNWDALTSDRPYRSAWSEERAAAYLTEQAGRKFDPELVEIFLSIARSPS